MAGLRFPTWDSEGYRPKYRFAYSGDENAPGLFDVTNVQTGILPDGQTLTGQDIATQRFGPVPMYDASNADPQYQYDHARFLQAASGQPGSGWAIGDSAGDNPYGGNFGNFFGDGIVGTAFQTLVAGAITAGAGSAAGLAAGGAEAGAEAATSTLPAWATTAGQVANYGGTGLRLIGQGTGNDALAQAGGALSLAGGVTGAAGGVGAVANGSTDTLGTIGALGRAGSTALGAAGQYSGDGTVSLLGTGSGLVSTGAGLLGRVTGDNGASVQGVDGSFNSQAQGTGDVRQVNYRRQSEFGDFDGVGDFSLDAPADTGGGGAFDGGVWSAVDGNGTVQHNSAPGGSDGSGWGSINDWLKAVVAAGGLANTGFQAVNSANASGKANDAAGLQAQIAQQLFNEASPLRAQNIAQLGQFAQTGELPTGLRVGLDALNTTGREDLEAQYNVARNNLLNLTPSRGGQLNSQLGSLETARAGSVGRLRSDILGQYEIPLRQNLYQLAVNQGLAQSTQGLNAVGGSATNFMSLAKSAAAESGDAGKANGAFLALLLRGQGR